MMGFKLNKIIIKSNKILRHYTACCLHFKLTKNDFFADIRMSMKYSLIMGASIILFVNTIGYLEVFY